MKTYSLKYVFEFICLVIDPASHSKKIEPFITENELFWERVIKLGSEHLVLPTILWELKRKKLVHHIPKDVLVFMEEILSQNSERNQSIYDQINFVTEIFNANNIRHVFFKGAAFLIRNPSVNFPSRMVGDIDVLVEINQCDFAQNLLIQNGFSQVGGSDNKNFRHLSRLSHPKHIAAIEVHNRIIQRKKSYYLFAEKVFSNAKKIESNYNIPTDEYLSLISIYNWRYNNNGKLFNYLHFRTVRDVLTIEQNPQIKKIYIHPSHHFYSLMSVFYKNYTSNVFFIFHIIMFKLQLTSPFVNKSVRGVGKSILLLSFLAKKIFSREFLLKNTKLLINSPKDFLKKIKRFWLRT